MLETIRSSQAYFNSTVNLVWSWCIPCLISTNIKILKRDTANYQCLAFLKIKQFTNVGIQLRNLLIYANLHFKEISKTKSYSTYPCSIYSENCCAGVHAVAFLLPQGPATLACLFFPFGSAGKDTITEVCGHPTVWSLKGQSCWAMLICKSNPWHKQEKGGATARPRISGKPDISQACSTQECLPQKEWYKRKMNSFISSEKMQNL